MTCARCELEFELLEDDVRLCTEKALSTLPFDVEDDEDVVVVVVIVDDLSGCSVGGDEDEDEEKRSWERSS